MRKSLSKHRWSTQEIELLRKEYPIRSREELRKLFPWVTRDYQLNLIARRYGISKKKYTSEELKQNSFGLHKLLEETPEAAYWIGFLLADGHFTSKRLIITLSTKDSEHLCKFQKFIGIGNVRYERNAITYTRQEPLILEEINKRFDLNNTKTYNPPKTLPYNDPYLLLSFLIGFIDGDGSIGYQYGRSHTYIIIKCHSSWEEFIRLLITTIVGEFNIKYNWKPLLNFKMVSKEKDSKIVYFTWSVFDQCAQADILDEASRLGLPFLKRKWERINLEYTHSYNLDRCTVVRDMLKSGARNKDIMSVTGASASQISNIKRKLQGR